MASVAAGKSISVRALIVNATSLLTSSAMNRAATFVLYALVARHLGASPFGAMSLALTLFYTFQVIAVAGMRVLITREVAKDTSKTQQYFVNGSVIVSVFSAASVGLAALVVQVLRYSPSTSSIILLLSLGLLPSSLSAVSEGIFQAWERMRYVAYANVPVNFARVGLAFVLLSRGFGLRALMLMLVGSYVMTLVIDWWFLFRQIIKPRLRIDFRFCASMVRSAGAFLGQDVIGSIHGSISFVMVSKFVSETGVGYYNASTQVITPILIVTDMIALSMYPVMSRTLEPGFRRVKQITGNLLELLLSLAVPVTIGLFLFPGPAFALFYANKSFLAATGALQIMVWMILLRTVNCVLGRVLWATRRERVTLRIVLIGAILNVILGFSLVSRFGLIGAAVSALLLDIIAFLQHFVAVARLVSGLSLGKFVWKSGVAGISMALCIVTLKSHGTIVSASAGCVVYAAVWLAIELWSARGFGQLRAKYLYRWS